MGELAVAFLTLTVLEVVLGVDNVIFISILSGKLRKEDQKRARRVGLIAAMLMRIALLFSITWIARLQTTLIEPFGHPFNGRDLILLVGGLFLIAKATYELHERLEGEGGHGGAKAVASFGAVITQVMLLDIVFSLDSVITAIGMSDHLGVMVSAARAIWPVPRWWRRRRSPATWRRQANSGWSGTPTSLACSLQTSNFRLRT